MTSPSHGSTEPDAPTALASTDASTDATNPAEQRTKRPPLPYRYAKVLPFNPHSTQQVAALAHHLGLKLPTAKGTDRETTEAKYLRRLAKKQPVFRSVLDCRQRKKLLSTYNWTLNEHGKVTTIYRYHPSTWRKSSRTVNLQNIPKRSDLAREFRRMLVASPGCQLVEADASAIEAVLVGYCAGSQAYIRLARAGVHGYLTSHIVGSPIDASLPDDQLTLECKATKRQYPDVYERAKRIVHLSNYMGTPHRIWDEYEEDFSSLRQVKELQEAYFSLVPDVRKWQQDTCQRAASEHFLENHWRYRHYFYNVYDYDRRTQTYRLGDDAKRAVAFIPQSDASAIQTELLLRLDAYEDLREWLRLIIHDSVVLDVPNQHIEPVCNILHREMTAPIPELGGLVIGAEVKYGPNLAEMEEFKCSGQ